MSITIVRHWKIPALAKQVQETEFLETGCSNCSKNSSFPEVVPNLFSSDLTHLPALFFHPNPRQVAVNNGRISRRQCRTRQPIISSAMGVVMISAKNKHLKLMSSRQNKVVPQL